MTYLSWRRYLPVCLPLALMACSSDSERQAQPAQDAKARADQQFQPSLQK